ncbi:MAG TPA: hypothetical protein VFL12_11405, partial [Thermoanaerobaculia bacterium]|nr:hypothetical protein [Thermoanaerobaculia bacterium]
PIARLSLPFLGFMEPIHGISSSPPPSPRLLWAGLLIVVAVGVLLRWGFAVHPRPAIFWDSASYVDYAKSWAQTGRIEGVDTRRSPGYPAFLVLVGRPILDAARVVTAQRVLGVLSGVLVFLLVWAMTRRVGVATAAGVGAPLILDASLFELAIYSETLALFLVTAALAGIAVAEARGRPAGAIAGCLAAGLGVTVRPVLLAAAPFFAASLIALVRGRRISRAAAAASLVLLALPTAAGALARGGRHTGSGFVGLTLLDYAGMPQLYRRLPPEMDDVRRVFERCGSPYADHGCGWYESIDELAALERRRTGREMSRDEAGTRVALRVIAAAPLGYAKVWRRAVRRFFTDVNTEIGFYASADDLRARRPQFEGTRATVLEVGRRLLKGVIPIFSLLALVGPPSIAIAHRRRSTAIPVAVALSWTTVVGVAVATASLEPSVGTGRYRVPVDLAILALVAWTLTVLFRKGPAAATVANGR